MNSCKKLDQETMMQFLYEIHLVQKGVTYSDKLEELEGDKRELLLLDKVLNDLFLVRVDRDPGFYSFILQEISKDETAVNKAIRYINKLVDDYSVDFESFLLHERFNSDNDVLNYRIKNPESFLRIVTGKNGELSCSSPLSGRNLNEIRLFYEHWSIEDLSEKDRLKDNVVRNILNRIFLHIDQAIRGFHHTGAFETPIVDRLLIGDYSERQKWKNISEMFIVQNIRSPKQYVDEVIYDAGAPYHQFFSNCKSPNDELKTIFDNHYYDLLKGYDPSSTSKGEASNCNRNIHPSHEIFLADALFIAAELWFTGKSNSEKIDLLNQDYSKHCPVWSPPETDGQSKDNFWEYLDTIDYFQYNVVRNGLHSTPSGSLTDKLLIVDYWFELQEYEKVIENIEQDFFSDGKEIWDRYTYAVGDLVAAYLHTDNKEKASAAIRHYISAELGTYPNYRPGFLDLILGWTISRSLSMGPETALSIIEDIRSEAEKYCDQSFVMQIMIELFKREKWYSKALEYSDEFIEQFPEICTIYQVYKDKGIMHLELGDPEKALDSLNLALESFNREFKTSYYYYEDVKSDIYYKQALAQSQLGRLTDAYTSIVNSQYLSYPLNKDERWELRTKIESCLSQHIDVDSVRCDDARYEFLTAEQQAFDYLINTPDERRLDFYSPILSLSKGLEIMLDQEVFLPIRQKIKDSEYWTKGLGIEDGTFHDIKPKNLKWALSRSDSSRETISLGTWSNFTISVENNNKIVNLLLQSLKEKYGSSFEEIKRICQYIVEHRNKIAHSKLMEKEIARSVFFDFISKINSIIRILYGENQISSPRIVIAEIESENTDNLFSKGNFFLHNGDYNIADLIFDNIIFRLKKTGTESIGVNRGNPVNANPNYLFEEHKDFSPLSKAYLMKGIAQKGLSNARCADLCYKAAKKIDPNIPENSLEELFEEFRKYPLRIYDRKQELIDKLEENKFD